MQSYLNKSEKEVYILALKGLSVEQIAKIRKVKSCTVSTQLSLIYQKKVVNNRVELLAQRIEELENELYSYKCKEIN